VRFNLVYLYYGKRDDIKIFCNHSSPSIAELKNKRYLFLKTKDKRQKTKKIKSKIKVIINETRLGGLEFAVSIIKLGKKLNKTYEGRHIYGQLFRAGTSTGTNYLPSLDRNKK